MMDEQFKTTFWEKVDRRGDDECWNWRGAPSSRGYGRIKIFGKTFSSHRIAYELANGPIPDGAGYHGTVVMHLCDNRMCNNPKHLDLGTANDNMQDMKKKGRQAKGSRASKSKLTEEQVIAIIKDSRTRVAIAKDYGVTPEAISSIKIGKTWRHITAESVN